MQAMGYSKMSVLHLHASDYGGFRIESKRHPALNAKLGGNYYTQQEIRGLVSFARSWAPE